jgi:hypothetical protein
MKSSDATHDNTHMEQCRLTTREDLRHRQQPSYHIKMSIFFDNQFNEVRIERNGAPSQPKLDLDVVRNSQVDDRKYSISRYLEEEESGLWLLALAKPKRSVPGPAAFGCNNVSAPTSSTASGFIEREVGDQMLCVGSWAQTWECADEKDDDMFKELESLF